MAAHSLTWVRSWQQEAGARFLLYVLCFFSFGNYEGLNNEKETSVSVLRHVWCLNRKPQDYYLWLVPERSLFPCLSTHWCVLCKEEGEQAKHLVLHWRQILFWGCLVWGGFAEETAVWCCQKVVWLSGLIRRCSLCGDVFYHFGGVFISMFPVKIDQGYFFLCGFRDCRCSVLRALWVGVVNFGFSVFLCASNVFLVSRTTCPCLLYSMCFCL